MELLLGKPVADHISEQLIKEVEGFNNKPKLAIVRLGENPNDMAYERGAKSRCEKIGIDVDVHEFSSDISQEELIDMLRDLNNDEKVNGILVFRPLPKHIDEDIIKHEVRYDKDVDCFNPINFGKLYEGDSKGFVPCTAVAVMEILKYYDIDAMGKNVAIIGASNVIGKPVSFLLLNKRATITVCHSKTKNTSQITSNSDIIVSACGVAKMVNESYVSEGAIVIDVGINVDENGKLCGDVDFENVKDIASMITPVPRGVGSVTTSILASHVVKAYKMHNNC
ncbi:bifunctional 5,10-methylenetetrahydrofolate dehydrogenase/5,10-methenyltetrahydrofolate cyclohydrolase [Clostridiaceae bacterium M8S5]|nr:bifunctional 5,10-methylenetetrahydrofolate dehydrogenase/5,10-methenyltetrahydrofolate cyclohydrolase [Clostridiaceae bacterium M8S5]